MGYAKKSKIPPLKTLKEWFEFLEWLKTQEDLQTKLAVKLVRRVNYYYSKKVDVDKIKLELSNFLGQVSHFYRKLCKHPKPGTHTLSKEKDVLDTLLTCIPKLLSAMYFLEYNVDKNFESLGGGGWAKEAVGSVTVQSSGISKIDSYLTGRSSAKYRVIPGGFSHDEVQPGDKGGYTDGSVIASNLPKILSNLQNNLFSDVFSTSVSTTAGSQDSNTANALALLKTFCDIVERELNEELEVYLEAHRVCIDWKKLKQHCAELRSKLDTLFANGRFSHTGQAPKNGDFNSKHFAKKMAGWLKDNLDKVRGNLEKIETNDHVLGNTQPGQLGEYLKKHFFPYGFTLEGFNLGDGSSTYDVLNGTWKAVIGYLNDHDSGLSKLVHILKGQPCPLKQSQKAALVQNHDSTADPESESDPEDEEEDDDDDDDDDDNDDNGGLTYQNNDQSVQQPGLPNEANYSDTPPEDGKGQGHAGTPGEAGKSAQGSYLPTQQLSPPTTTAHTTSTSTPRPGHPSSGVSDTDIVMGSQVTKGDQGAPGPVTLNSSPQRVQTDPQSVKQEPSQGVPSPDSAISPTAIPASGSQPGNADGGDQGLQNNSNAAEWDVTSQAAAVSQHSSVSGSVTSPSGSLSSDRIQQPNAQLVSKDNQQSAQGSLQSLSATTMTTSAVKSSDSGISVPGGVGTSSIVQLPVPNIKISCEVGKFDANTSDTNSMVVPKEQTNTLPKVIVDVIKPTVATYGDHFQSTPSLTLPVSFLPSYDAINDESDKTKEMRSNSEGNVELFIDVAKYPSPQPLAKYDAEDISALPKLVKPKVADLYDSALKDAERAKIYTPLAVFPGQSPFDDNTNVCQNPYYVPDHSTDLIPPIVFPPPDTDHLPPPRTVREMLYWMVGVLELGYIGFIRKHVDVVLDDVNTDSFLPTNVLLVTRNLTTVTSYEISQTLTKACHYAAKVLHRLKHRDISKDTSIPEFNAEYSQLHYSSNPARLLCQLRDYAYACHYQLAFLKSQCNRSESHSGWKEYEYGSDTKTPSPLQAFLTDGWDSDFETHLFDPCNLCRKSRVRMGFKRGDLPNDSQTGTTLATILTPSCGGEDPLLTLASYLNCLTRRTPRTTGELVSYFHNFGNELHGYASESFSPLGNSLLNPHPDCPDWDRLGRHDLGAVKGIGGQESINYKLYSNHNHDHPRTLSTLVGCGDDSSNCPQHCSPITYRAYALYSQSFVHTYLSWVVYLPDRLHESLQKLHYDLQKHRGSSKCSSLHLCSTALPLLYLHGFTPPEGTPPSITCSELITKLGEIANGWPIATLMTCMDDFLYRVRMPFIYTLIALWSVAVLLLSYTILYRLDILYLCSHAIRSKASHLIDVKALLTNSRKMLSLYDADYFEDDPNDLIDQLK